MAASTLRHRQDLESRVRGLGSVSVEELISPVSYEPYQNAVVLPCGHIIDRAYIEAGVTQCVYRCPNGVVARGVPDFDMDRRIRDSELESKLDWAEKYETGGSAEILLFCIDRSTSMGWNDKNWGWQLLGYKVPGTRLDLAKELVMTVYDEHFTKRGKTEVPSKTKVELIWFGSDVSKVQDVCKRDKAVQVLASIEPTDHHSGVFDGVYRAIRIVQTYPKAKFKIVVLTDGGEDGHSDPKKREEVEAELSNNGGRGGGRGHFDSGYWSRCLRNVLFCSVDGSGNGQAQAKKFADKYDMEFMSITWENLEVKAKEICKGYLRGIGESLHSKAKEISRAKLSRIGVASQSSEILSPAVETLKNLPVPSRRVEQHQELLELGSINLA